MNADRTVAARIIYEFSKEDITTGKRFHWEIFDRS
jgi:hypothetical protein